MSSRARLLIAAAILGVLAILAGAGLVAWRLSGDGKPVGTPVVDVLPIVDRGIAAALTAAGDTAAVAVAPVTQVGECSLGKGGGQGRQYARAADLYTNAGQEGSLISRIEGGLPADMTPRREAAVGNNAAPLLADLGSGVQLSVRQLGDGWVVARAETSCHAPTTLPPSTPQPQLAVESDVAALLAKLPATVQTWRVDSVSCAGVASANPESGDQIVTTVAISQPTDSSNLPARMLAALPAGAREFLADSANRWAYRSGATSVIVAASDDATLVTLRYTVSC